jgi:hypothetical protein
MGMLCPGVRLWLNFEFIFNLLNQYQHGAGYASFPVLPFPVTAGRHSQALGHLRLSQAEGVAEGAEFGGGHKPTPLAILFKSESFIYASLKNISAP